MSVTPSAPNRRTVLAVGGSAAVAALAAACTSDPGSSNAASSSAAKGSELAAVSDVPDGGALVVGQVVLARTGNTVTAHSAVCTHQGCAVVAAAAGDQLNCPCHGSQFTASTGAVLHPPATSPLPEVTVTVKDGKVFQG